MQLSTLPTTPYACGTTKVIKLASTFTQAIFTNYAQPEHDNEQ